MFDVVTTLRKASFASAVYATANPSVCLSVTLRYCVKMRERRGMRIRMRSSPSGSSVPLSSLVPSVVDGDDPVQVNLSAKRSTPAKTAELYTFRLITLEP